MEDGIILLIFTFTLDFFWKHVKDVAILITRGFVESHDVDFKNWGQRFSRQISNMF